MSFDTDPADEKENYECPRCGDVVSKDSRGVWACETCDWTPKKKGAKRI
jgi:ribosomal protein L37AE/L43A